MPVALVTAGSHGLGRAIAEDLSAHDWKVGITYRHHQEDAQSFIDAHRDAYAQHAELSDRRNVAHLISALRERFGTIDALVHCAGSFDMADAKHTTDALWQHLMDDNAKSTLMVLGQMIEDLRVRHSKGNIVVLSSPEDLLKPYYIAYNASIQARLGIVRDLAEETKDEGIAVNALTFLAAENSARKPPIEMMPRKRYVPVQDIVQSTRKMLEQPEFTGEIIQLS